MPTTPVSELQLSQYEHTLTGLNSGHTYLLPAVFKSLAGMVRPVRVLELGCGNGSASAELARCGFTVTGVDASESGIEIARTRFQQPRFEIASAYDDLTRFGEFDVVLSLEVVEHLFYPREYAKNIERVLKPGGIAIVSTPYHGYLKNLMLSLFNAWDNHHAPLWDYGHIKFWSIKTLTQLFAEVGMRPIKIYRVGRLVPQLAKSMVIVFQKPY